MQVVILAGGRGTRISEENNRIPKPLVEVGSIPILIHLMRYFASFGHKEFVILLGYKSKDIKRYFMELQYNDNDIEIDFAQSSTVLLSKKLPIDWKITLVETGMDTLTGGRVLYAENYLHKEFFLTYGDGLSDVNLDELLKLHKESEKIATVTAVNPPSRYGALELKGNVVESCQEKPVIVYWVNAGFFLFKREICNFIVDGQTVLEREPLEQLAAGKQLMAYKHRGFWLGMDTMRDRETLESLWQSGKAPWLRD
jgi:glucose-1-phosphate cytidylyltransferase